MQRSDQKNPWWRVTPQGLMAISGVIVISAIITMIAVRHNNSLAARDQAAIEEMVNEANAFTKELRCIREVTWRLTNPEAEHAELQIALAAEGLPAEWVDPAVLERLRAAKRCP